MPVNFPDNPDEGDVFRASLGEEYIYSKTRWVRLSDYTINATFDLAGLADVNITNPQAGDKIVWNGSSFDNSLNINDFGSRDYYYFNARPSASQSIPNVTYQIMTMDVLDVEFGGNNYNTGTSTFTIPYSGYWFFSALFRVDFNTKGAGNLKLYISDGTTHRWAGHKYQSDGASDIQAGYFSKSASLLEHYNQNDQITLRIYQNEGSAIPTLYPSGSWSGYLVEKD